MSANGNLLWCLSCPHEGSAAQAVSELDRYIKWAKDTKADIIMLGDLIECGLPWATKHIGSIWEQDMKPRDQIRKAIERYRPIAKQIRYICGGNHASRVEKLTSFRPEEIIAEWLGVPYVPNCHTFTWNGFTMMMAHGAGPADFKKAIQRHSGVDVFLFGHTHELKWERLSQFVGVKQKRKDIWWGRVGSFMDNAEYAKTAIYPPTPVGSLILETDGAILQARLGLGVQT